MQSLSEIVRNRFKETLAAGRVASTLSIRLPWGVEIVHAAESCGFDAIYIDLQHSPLSLETASQMSIAALALGITPIVRVPNHSPDCIARVLDGGALGVLAPHVETSDEAKAIVSSAKFAPLGGRSTGGGLPQLRYRHWPQDDVVSVMNDATIVLVQIESPAAVDRSEQIAGVPGVDGFMIGANDLCAGYGIPGQHGHELIRSAYARVIAAANKVGKYVGVGGISDRKLIAQYVQLGARIVATGTDVSMMMEVGTERARFVESLNG
jgi:4-hydroxy-2-oxoheptanedioate aldolase